MIRIGSSCALSIPMAWGKVVETRILTDNSTKWKEVSRYAIKNNKYLILTPCVNDGYNRPHIPSDAGWQNMIDTACRYLKSIRATRNNCEVSIINEPTKWFRNSGGVMRYVHFIDMAYEIIHSYGLLCGAGNMEFYDAAVLGDWLGVICSHAHFDNLHIHIQASCDTEERIIKYTDYAHLLATTYHKGLSCTEAFYGDIKTQYSLLTMQLAHAERIGCENFCNVFNNLDTSVFPILEDEHVRKKWYKLCFNINNVKQTNNWDRWIQVMEAKAPVPNIKKGVKDGMIIKTIGWKPDDVKGGYGVELLHELLIEKEYMSKDSISNMFKYTDDTKNAIEKFQGDLDITVDGRVGRQTWRKFINSIEDGEVRSKFQFDFEVVMSPYNFEGDT